MSGLVSAQTITACVQQQADLNAAVNRLRFLAGNTEDPHLLARLNALADAAENITRRLQGIGYPIHFRFFSRTIGISHRVIQYGLLDFCYFEKQTQDILEGLRLTTAAVTAINTVLAANPSNPIELGENIVGINSHAVGLTENAKKQELHPVVVELWLVIALTVDAVRFLLYVMELEPAFRMMDGLQLYRGHGRQLHAVSTALSRVVDGADLSRECAIRQSP